MKACRLGVNIDHVATLRNARGGLHPDPVLAAKVAIEAGADGITAHLREDRRHITDGDIKALQELAIETDTPLNLEMAPTDEMLDIALSLKPHAVCLVPEKREERTTEGGLDVAGLHNQIAPIARQLADNGSRVSLFIEANERQIQAALSCKAQVVEFHTGAYAESLDAGDSQAARDILEAFKISAVAAHSGGLEVHFGHGLTFENVTPVASIPEAQELNIGHFIIGKAVFMGLGDAIRENEMARQLGLTSMFVEREEGEFVLRRGFKLRKGQAVLMVEDIITTGLSSRECIAAIQQTGAKVVAGACLFDRSGGDANIGVPLISLASQKFPAYKPEDVPEDMAKIRAIKPGSRGLS